jgi:excisionase family DNA binding protein
MNNQYISIKDAAEILGVTTLTLRNWDKKGKLKALRHPLNNYRVYKKEDIDELLLALGSGSGYRKPKPSGPKKIFVRHIPGDQ